MEKICSCHQPPRQQRRVNGIQLPLHIQQVIGWLVLVVTTIINFLLLLPLQFHELNIVSQCLYVIMYISHFIAHVTALLVDPAEKNLRRLSVRNVPEFDRSLHAHVIENGRCHLCNIDTSSKGTKHCSICNKCVYYFDHHCKWMNHCIGKRNYAAFFLTVTTATMLALYTSALCFSNIIFYYSYSHLLSSKAKDYLDCDVKQCQNEIKFIVFLSVYGALMLTTSCVLLHLCLFHIYISALGTSTYDYVIRQDDYESQNSQSNFSSGCLKLRKLYICWSLKRKDKHQKLKSNLNSILRNSNGLHPKSEVDVVRKTVVNSNLNIANIMTAVINTVDKTNRLLYNKNQVHPSNEINYDNGNFVTELPVHRKEPG